MASAAEDAKFNEWLLNHHGATVTAVKGDRSWNASVVKGATDKITGKSGKK